jgi:hypothetical protein
VPNFLRRLVAWIAFGFCAHLPAAEPQATPGEWKSISKSDNVEIYRRFYPGPANYESKAVGDIAAPVATIHAVIEDLESHAKFMPYLAECRVLKRDGDSTLSYQRISAPLVSDRDYTVRIRTTSKKTEAGTSYLIKWETDNALGPPEKRGVLRVQICQGSWLLEPAGPELTRATYTILTDSGGALPTFIKQTGSQMGIRKMFAAIRKQVRDPKYAAARQ